MVVLKCKVCPLWVGLDQCPVKVSWLGGLVPVFWSMELDLVSPVGSVMSSSNFRVSMCLIQLWAACLRQTHEEVREHGTWSQKGHYVMDHLLNIHIMTVLNVLCL